jgi:hypothetical protein
VGKEHLKAKKRICPQVDFECFKHAKELFKQYQNLIIETLQIMEITPKKI